MILEKNLEKWREKSQIQREYDHTPKLEDVSTNYKMATKTQIEQTLIYKVAISHVDFENLIGQYIRFVPTQN